MRISYYDLYFFMYHNEIFIFINVIFLHYFIVFFILQFKNILHNLIFCSLWNFW